MEYEQFLAELKDWLCDLKGIFSQNVESSRLKTYTSDDVQGILKVSKKTLQTWRDKGYIGFSQPEGIIRYTEDDINGLLNRFKK